MADIYPEPDPFRKLVTHSQVESGNENESPKHFVTMPLSLYRMLVDQSQELGLNRMVFDFLPFAVHVIDIRPEGLYFSFVSRAAWNLMQLEPLPGITVPNKLLGKNIREVGFDPEYLSDLEADIALATQSNRPVQSERVIGEVEVARHILAIVTPIKVFSEVTRIILTQHDITDLKALQDAKLEADGKIEALQRVSLFVSLISAIAHDANSSITSLMGHIRLAEDDLKSGTFDIAEVRGFLHQALIASENLSLLMRRFRSASLVSVENIARNDIATMLQRVMSADLGFAKTTLGRRGRDLSNLKVSIESQGDTIAYVDALSLNSTLVNLMKNSLEALVMRPEHSKGGDYQPRITTSCTSDETHVYIEITDNGVGIGPEDIENIFNPKFTSKSGEAGLEGGAGFGLYACKEIINLHHGEITVQSEPNNFTTFRIKIPKIQPVPGD